VKDLIVNNSFDLCLIFLLRLLKQTNSTLVIERSEESNNLILELELLFNLPQHILNSINEDKLIIKNNVNTLITS
jgi:hypothetical protein